MRNTEIPLKETYDLTFYDRQFRESYRAAQLILPHVLEAVGRPSSVLDIGCGVGTWLRCGVNQSEVNSLPSNQRSHSLLTMGVDGAFSRVSWRMA
jgi:hypothetical protein